MQRAVARILAHPLAYRFRFHAAALALVAPSVALYWSGLWLHTFLPPSVLKWADDTFSTASAYYAEQRPLFAAVAKGYELYWPFAQTRIDSLDIGAWEIVTARMEAWAKMFQDLGRDDFRVEKDKCEMYRFFQRALLPHERILRSWNNTEGVIRDVNNMGFFDNVVDWPIFLKSCHLTQFTSQSVLTLKSRNWVAEHKEYISKWVRDKWDFRADDADRLWRDVAKVLTDPLVPGFFVQAPTPLTHDVGLGGWQPWEMKVDVIWGRAYTAGMVAPVPDNGFFLRSPTGGAEYHSSIGLLSLAYLGRFVPRSMQKTYVQTVLNGKHLELCVFPLAERLAQTLRIDHVRVDIFIRGDDPTRCAINEISLSSAHPMNSHRNYVPRLWAEPFVDRTFEVYGNASSKPAYMRTAGDPPRTPRKIGALPEVRISAWVLFWQMAGLAITLAAAAGVLAGLLGRGPCSLGDKIRPG